MNTSLQALKAASFFHPSVCHWCKGRQNLKHCGRCKSIFYCSKEHQRKDWISHKLLCAIISHTDKTITVIMQNDWEMKLIASGFNERTNFFASIFEIWMKKLKRVLHKYEMEILMFRKTCIVCNSRNAVIECNICSSIFYCCLDHQTIHNEKHAVFCKNMKLCFDMMLYNFNHLIPRTCFLSFHQKSITPNKFPENLQKLMEILERNAYLNIPRNLNYFEKLNVSDAFAPIATIIFGLEVSNLLKNNTLMKDDLTVHMIGANYEEMSWNWRLLIEFMFHWIQNINTITFVAIGPEVGSWNLSNEEMMLHPTCGSCQMKSSNIKCYSSANYYHDVVDNLEIPDIVVAFNCGIAAIPTTWGNTIPSLFKYPRKPLILTDYTLDYTKQDVSIVRNTLKKEIDIIVEAQRNPFSCVTPRRHDPKSFPIYYNNGYIAIMKSK